jgi:hypothetical protein|tara:strand:- start:1307 stop:1594 length:288 start_codon:yes stop_codon:yes gene_type:complete
MTEKKPDMLIGLDGIKRKPKDEENLNTLFYKMFNTPGGSEILKHLKSLTIEAVGGPEISDTSLRHLEGQRYIVGLIQRRFNKGVSQNMIQENKDV